MATTTGSAFEANMDDIIKSILAKDGLSDIDKASTSHILWLKREAVKQMRNEIALAEKEDRLAKWEKSLSHG